MDRVALGIREQLDFNVPWTLEETFDEDGTIAKGGLGLGDGTFEGGLEVGLFADDTHTTTSTTHSCFDDH